MCPWATSTIRIECTSLRRCDQEPRAHCRHPPAKQIVPCQIGVHRLAVYSRSNIKSRLEQEWNRPCLLLVLLISHDCSARLSARGVVSCVSVQWPIHPHQEIRCTPKEYRDTDCIRVWLMFLLLVMFDSCLGHLPCAIRTIGHSLCIPAYLVLPSSRLFYSLLHHRRSRIPVCPHRVGVYTHMRTCAT